MDPVTVYKISPLAGPVGGQNKVKIYGTGYNSSIPIETPVYVKFGTIESQEIDKTEVEQESWSEDGYHTELNIPKNLLSDAEEHDKALEDGQDLRSYMDVTVPSIHKLYNEDDPDVLNQGGPVFIEVGERVPVRIIDHNPSNSGYKDERTDFIEVAYPQSSKVEYYFYRQPIATKMEPLSGLVDGGTNIDITGAWFDLKPEYGVFPFCKIGENIIRAKFVQTNRIICSSPPSKETMAPQPVSISLNGVDFSDSGFEFSYYEKPELSDVQPRSGSIDGGTEIWLKGSKFSNVTHTLKSVRCRFRQLADPSKNQTWGDEDAPTKFIPAYFVDNQTMKCATPAGWRGGDKVMVDLTFNGVDYTENSFPFDFYTIYGSFPKSGPANAFNQYI